MIQRVLAAVAGLTAVVVPSACGGESQAGRTSSIAAQPTASEPAADEDERVGPAPADREVHELTGFVSSTGNVSCMIARTGRAAKSSTATGPPPRPADCEFDYGHGISLAPGEQAKFVCSGDTAFGADEVLPDGESLRAAVLRCESAESWITCRDIQTAHGFSISREAYRLF
jgi:hypothetical protein